MTTETDAIQLNDVQSSTVNLLPAGFFRLPREIHNTIYFEVLRPDFNCVHPAHLHSEHWLDWNGALGCTNLLLLSKRIYKESIEILHAYKNIIGLRPDSRTLRRDPFANGKPTPFFSFKESLNRECPIHRAFASFGCSVFDD